MKAGQFARLLIPLFCAMACANKNHDESSNDNNAKDSIVATSAVSADTFPAGKVVTPVFCKSDATQSYALYIPAKGNSEALPVVYFFDPHGDGSFPLSKYKALADTFNFILIGSNNSKNGNDWPATENIWNILFEDSKKRVKINTRRIYTCGFSGGARVAGYVGLHHNEVEGVIANGAGMPDATETSDFHFSLTAVTGYGDMNMTELVAVNSILDKTRTRHRIIFFDGKHEWAPQNTMNMAFAGLQLDAMYENLLSRDDAFISNYIAGSKKRIDAYVKAGSYIKAETECTLSINLCDGLPNDANWFKEKKTSLQNNPVYQKQSQAQQNLLITEQNLKTVYTQQFEQGDMSYWTKTVNDLQAKTRAQTAEGAMYQRLLAYLSLAFYSISNQLIMGSRNKEAEYFVALYKIADATNSEAWYFSAILDARSNNAKATENDLLKAVSCGFADKNRMMQQPEFRNLGTQINLEDIGSKIK